MGGHLGVEGVECGFKVQGELIEGLFGVGDGSICHLIIPGFSIRGSSSTAHLVQGGHDLGSIRRVESRVQGEVGLHGLYPLGGIIIFAGEVGGEGGLQFSSV